MAASETMNCPGFDGGLNGWCLRDLLGLFELTVVQGLVFCRGMWSSVPCRRRWFHHPTHARVASSTWAAVRHGPRGPISSALYRPLTASASALSKESPREPTEVTAPSSARRWV